MQPKAKLILRIGLLSIGVVILVGLVASPSCHPRPSPRSDEVARVFVDAIGKTALLSFRFQCGRFPTTEEGLRALTVAPVGLEAVWDGPYLDAKWGAVPKDPWGREYRYVCPGVQNPERYDLWSLGPDGVESSDDIFEKRKARQPNQALQTTPVTRSVYEKTIELGDPQRGV